MRLRAAFRQRQRQKLQGCWVGGAGWLCRTRRESVHGGSLFASLRKDGPAQPPRPTFDRSAGALVAPTHGRRNVSANGPLRSPTMAMPVVLTGTLRAVASDVGSGSCRCLRRYQGAVPFRVEGAPESGAAAKRRGVGDGETGPAVCAAKRGSGSANAMAWTRHGWRETRPAGAALAVPRTAPPAGPDQGCCFEATREGVLPVRPHLTPRRRTRAGAMPRTSPLPPCWTG